MKPATRPIARLHPLWLALLGAMALPAMAQDSGVGVDLHFGNALDPSGAISRGCDANGMSWLSAERKRTPSGQLYPCVPDFGQSRELASGWLFSGSFGLGYIDINDENNTNWLRYNDWSDGLIARLALSYMRPADGSYAELRGSRINADNLYVKGAWGRAGHFRLEAFARSQPNVTSGAARSIWDGVGSNSLTLLPGLTPGGSTEAEVAAASAGTPPQVLKVVRDKFGVSGTYMFSRQTSAYFSASHEKREGARPFGGPFFFAFIFPGSGGVYETPRPIDDSTFNFNAGLRHARGEWNFDIGYSGSMFRNGGSSFDYEVPFAFPSVVPGFDNFPLTMGEFAYEPENDYHNIRGTATRKLKDGGQFSITASFSRSSQDDDLLPPMNCPGGQQFGLTAPPFAFDCSDWNTTAALSRPSADLAIDSTLVNARLVMRPTHAVTVQGNVKFHRQDYKGTYSAYNPLTGQYGYIAENGAQGSSVPFEMGVWDPNLFPSVITRIRNLPLDKEILEANAAVDWRVNPENTLGASLTFTRTDRTHREVARQDDMLLKLTWSSRAIDDMTLRANYSYLDRSGSDYDYDPYHFTYSTDLPGFIDDGTVWPHTIAELRKYDVGDRKQHKATLIATLALPGNHSLSGTLRGDRNDYDAEFGRQDYDTLGASLSWDWQPDERTSANLFLGYDRSELAIANINERSNFRNEPELGGDSYAEAGRWWVDDEQRNYYAGSEFKRTFARGTLEFGWNLSDSRGDTGYRFNSPAALAYPALASAAGDGFAPMVRRVNTFHLAWSMPLTSRIGLRLFDTYETGELSDWHYLGFDQGLVTWNRVYLDAGPSDYSVNMIGALLEVQL
ncbi:MtrB/PioB family outer membrane beta-barrel protein [Luteimonas sp. 8-5]|uniref:MtrB/PioB family outer membrane beta-barrel protein n=1 Tax=Luteimonas sp. 8-5 TaxID=3039387 RepID=UPI002436EE1C|nr:MtrB/PioB family outer membrane beta-barrel protein [Luteimonas sp. 8-5]MDG6348520.1 MtrB/PioB family outer membrane beta-barrel protein [Luteimonas sp. 8-5]